MWSRLVSGSSSGLASYMRIPLVVAMRAARPSMVGVMVALKSSVCRVTPEGMARRICARSVSKDDVRRRSASSSTWQLPSRRNCSYHQTYFSWGCTKL